MGPSGQSTQKSKRPMSRKARMIANEREMNQFQQVLKVEAFKKDPLGAVEQHLRNSLKRQHMEERQRKLRERVGRTGKTNNGKKPLSKLQTPKGVIKTNLKKKSKGFKDVRSVDL